MYKILTSENQCFIILKLHEKVYAWNYTELFLPNL